MNTQRFIQSTAMVLVVLFGCSCTKMSTPQKITTILVTGGLAGTALSYYGQAEAASGIAAGMGSGFIPSGSILMANETYASPVQERRARLNARYALANMPQEKREALTRDNVRFIAVDTVRDDDSRGQRAIMVYDIEADDIADSTVYDVRIAPEVGTRVQFDTFVTEYVGGSGSADEGFAPKGDQSAPQVAPRP